MASVSISGNIGRDPELKAAGTSQVLAFSVADSEFIPSKSGDAPGQWYNIEVWGKAAERLSGRLSKGMKVVVHGQLCQRPYTSKAGKEGVAMEVKQARVIEMSKPAAAADELPF